MASLSCSYALKASNSNITNQITTMEKNNKTYADKMDFVNMKLILGVNGEKSVSVAFTGLNATIRSIEVFLGGYYSVLPETTVALTPNATNFIYIDRDAADRNKLIVTSRTTLRGAEGQSSFSFFNAAKAVTNASSVISSKIYEVVH